MRIRSTSSGIGTKFGLTVWSLFWVALSGICLFLGVKNYFQERAFLAQAGLYTGTITRYELYVRHDGKSEYCPRIEFTDNTGEPVAVLGNDCPNQPDKSKIGTTEQVYYDPQNPDSYEEKSPTTGYDGLIFGTIGAVFFSLFWFIPLVIVLVSVLKPAPPASARSQSGYTPAHGADRLLAQDADRYHANQQAAAHAHKKAHADVPPDDEARLAQLKQQEAELQRKIDERRRQQGQ